MRINVPRCWSWRSPASRGFASIAANCAGRAASYTIDTLRELRDELGPRQPIAWLIGGDALVELDTWRDWRRLFDYAHVIAAERPGVRIDADWLAVHAPHVHAETASRRRDAASLRDAPAGGYAVFAAAAAVHRILHRVPPPPA